MTIERMSAEAILELKVIANGVDDLIGRAHEVTNGIDGMGRSLKDLDAQGTKVASTLRNMAGEGTATTTSTRASSRAIAEGSDKWQQYVRDLSAASAAHREFRQGQVTGETGLGRDATALPSLDRDALLATADAQAASAIGALRKIRSEEEAAANFVEKLRQESFTRSVALSEQEKNARIADMKAISAAYATEEAKRREVQANARYVPGASAQGLSAEQISAMQSAQGRTVTKFSTNARAMEEETRAAQEAQRATTVLTQAQAGLTAATGRSTDSIIASRYALYDVATTYGIVSVAALGAATAITATGANFQSAFTNVERTTQDTGASVIALREELVDLSTQIPVSFQGITDIATLANQLGIASEDVTEFTELVAKFSVVSGMTAEASAQAFGRLSNILGIPIAEASRLASAIELVGVNSASTDVQIIALAERLGSTATRAGFTSDQVIGLSGALGSLGVAPERAQGVFETYFNSINESIAEGGKKLEYFTTVTGLAAGELQAMVRGGQGYEVFEKFLAGLQGADSVELTTALDGLGLSGLRANEVIGRISGNLPLLKAAFADAAQGARENTELDRQYALILDDLNTQLQLLWQSVQALMAQGGAELIPGLTGAVKGLKELVDGGRELMDNDVAAFFVRTGIALVTLAGLYAGYQSTMALATASTYALTTAQQGLAAQNVRGGVSGLIGAVRGLAGAQAAAAGTGRGLAAANVAVDGSSRAAAGGTLTLAAAVRTLLRSTLVLLGISVAVELIFNLGSSMRVTSGIAIEFSNFMREAARNIEAVGTIASAIGGPLGFLGSVMANVGKSIGIVDAGGRGMLEGWKSWANQDWADPVDSVADSSYELSDALADAEYGSYNAADGLGALGDAADSTAARVYTLVDYASDLSGVFQRAFDIRFSGQQGFDTITSGWSTIRKAIADTNIEIADYQRTMASLTADKAIKMYWLSVAENYGDALRAGKLRAEIGELDADLAKTSKDLTAAQQANSKTLVGNSDAAVANRAEILGLVTSYEDYITKLASSGMSQAQLTATAARLKQEFIAQATQLGYSGAEVQRYAAAFDDVSTAIAKIPRNITVDANTDPALQALAEFDAKARSMANNKYSGGTISGPVRDKAADEKEARRVALQGNIDRARITYERALKSGADNVTTRALAELQRLSNILASGNYASGGYTGDGGKYEPKGIVHGGEFVFSKAATSRIGVENLAYAHNMAKSGMVPRAAAASSAPSGTMVVELSAYDRQLLADAGNMSVVIPGVMVAKAVSNNNINGSNRGNG